MNAIAPMTSVAKFHFSLSSHQCLLALQLSFIFCEYLRWQNSEAETFQPLSISRKFILFVLYYIFCNILPWQSISSSYCRYQSLSHSPPQQNFRQLLFSFQKVWGYPTLLIWWFINFKTWIKKTDQNRYFLWLSGNLQ